VRTFFIQSRYGDYLTALPGVCWTPFAKFAKPVSEAHALDIADNVPGARICVRVDGYAPEPARSSSAYSPESLVASPEFIGHAA
jgi:hypothetical protein